MKLAARFFKVLADEARLKILWLLMNHPELCVCDVMAVVAISQSKASRHLAALRNAGLVTDRKEGLWCYYSLRPAGSDLAKGHVELLRGSLRRLPEAPELLSRLRHWLGRRGQGVICTKDAAVAFMPNQWRGHHTRGTDR